MAQLKDRYARALFELSIEENALDTYVKQAIFMRDVLQKGDCESFLVHPHIPDTAKLTLLESLFAKHIAGELMGFLKLAVSRSREALMIPALTAYIDMANQQLGKIEARVVSATKLRDEQVAAIHALLSRKLDKQVTIHTDVEPALIGGFYIYIEGRLIDRTVRRQLYNMKTSLERGGAE